AENEAIGIHVECTGKSQGIETARNHRLIVSDSNRGTDGGVGALRGNTDIPIGSCVPEAVAAVAVPVGSGLGVERRGGAECSGDRYHGDEAERGVDQERFHMSLVVLDWFCLTAVGDVAGTFMAPGGCGKTGLCWLRHPRADH